MLLEPKAWVTMLDERPSEADDRGFLEDSDAAIVEIRGPLLRRAEGLMGLFCDNYEAIRDRAAAAFASGASRVVLRIDSPGGDAGGCFELSRELRAMSLESGKALIAYADGNCCSAAYAIACAAEEIVAAPTSVVGSIGVFQPMVDVTAQDRALGMNVVVVASGEAKTDGNPHVAITKEAVARVQDQVDDLAGLFFDLVADMRSGVTADEVRALKGGTFLGVRAVGVGLADRVSAWGDLMAPTAQAAAASSTKEENMAEEKKDGFATAKEALRAIVDDEKASAEEREIDRKSVV